MKFSTVILESTPIVDQLYIEEALLRADDRNVLLVNMGSPPAIVMGISGKPEELIYQEKVLKDDIPLIKRFSGGGTVVVDENTLFVTLICNTEDFPVKAQPKAILEWGQQFFEPLIPGIELRENDFVLGDLKIGGNAQYIRKGRWLLHTSFLWDFCPKKMEYLKLPKKRPDYRKDRSHETFLTTLKERLCKETLIDSLKKMGEPIEDLKSALAKEHRRSTTLINISQ